MWTSNAMTFGESIITFLIGFSIVFVALISLALFIIVSSKVINLLVKEDNQEEVERLAVIISAISEEMREPVENFSIVSITEI